MKLRKIVVGAAMSAFMLCSINTVAFADSKKDEILATMENTQKIGPITVSDVVSSKVYDWYESNDPSKSAEGKTFYSVDVEKGAYIYSDMDNTQFIVAISNSLYDLESNYDIMTTDKGYSCPAYSYDVSDRGIKAFPSTKNSNGTWSEGLMWQLNFTDVEYTVIRVDIEDESYYYAFSQSDRTFDSVTSVTLEPENTTVTNDTNTSENTEEENEIDVYSMNNWENIKVIDALPEKATAVPNSSKVYVDGKEVKFEAYNINGSNYFKLRDIAYAMNGTKKQFDVTWNPDISILSMTPGNSYIGVVQILPYKAYTTVGGELSTGNGKSKPCSKTNAPICVDETSVRMACYNIDGNNFVKLRDIGKLFNFYVGWENNSIVINSSSAYNG